MDKKNKKSSVMFVLLANLEKGGGDLLRKMESGVHFLRFYRIIGQKGA